MPDPSRFIGFTAVRYWRQIGRIGFDQYALQGHGLRDILDRNRVLKSDDARKGNIEIQLQSRLRDLEGLGEAMHYPAGFVGALFAHNAQSVVAGVSGMNNQWLGALARGADMSAEARYLPLRIARLAVVIQRSEE